MTREMSYRHGRNIRFPASEIFFSRKAIWKERGKGTKRRFTIGKELNDQDFLALVGLSLANLALVEKRYSAGEEPRPPIRRTV